MKICGVEFKGSEARLAAIEVIDDVVNHLDIATKKIPLGDSDNSTQVKSFQETFESFCRDYGINMVCIKKRSKKGEYAGGPDTFKMEGIIQASSAPEVTLISPQTISAMNKRSKIDIPKSLNKYQHAAYLTSVAGTL